MLRKPYIIIIPGIFKREGFVKRLRSGLSDVHGEISVYRIAWIGRNSYHKSYEKLKSLISEKNRQGYAVTLIGTSAGASVARTLFNDPRLHIRHLITICGPIRDAGTLVFAIGKTISPTWRTSLAVSSAIRTDRNASGIHTIIPRYDELVPLRTMNIRGANVVRIPGVEHLYSITSATSSYAANIIEMF